MSAVEWPGRSPSVSNPRWGTPPPADINPRAFGWERCSGVIFPFINRLDKKYCSVQMLKLATRLSGCRVQPEALDALMRKVVSATTEEASLFDFINVHHCDQSFGKATILKGEPLVELTDARSFITFLEDCRRLFNDPSSAEQKCGFIRINKEAIIPFVLIGGNKHVPLHYFKTVTKANIQTETLETKAMNEWDSCYMKFCSRIVGADDDYDFYGDHFVDLLNVTPFLSFYAEVEEYIPPEEVYKQFFDGTEEIPEENNSTNQTVRTKRRYVRRNAAAVASNRETQPIEMKQKENTLPDEYDQTAASDASSSTDSINMPRLKKVKYESEDARQMRLKKMRETARQQRLKETPEQREKRLVKLRMSQAKRLAKETPEQREKRLLKLRMYHIMKKQKTESTNASV